MALKLKLTKAEYDALPDAIKAEYKADGDSYTLDVSGIEDTGALRRAHERTKAELDDAKRLAKEAQDKLDALGTDAARKAGDIQTLEKSWQTKLDTAIAERDTRLKSLEDGLKNAAISSATSAIASKLTDHTAILSPHIRSRLTAEIGQDGQAVVRILDGQGKVSALSADDLQKEFAGNKEFSAIIRVSKASGGGATGTNGSSGNRSDGTSQTQSQDLSRMNPRDLAAVIAARKSGE